MFKKELIIPALLGLGLYAQSTDLNLANNTTMLLLLYLLLEDHQHIEGLERRVDRIERSGYSRRYNHDRFARFDGFDDCGCRERRDRCNCC